ncbi:hypothetical protein RFF05_06445 [Bengtsoniella intestinalis]
MGPALYAIVKGLTGRSSFAILAIILLFFIGFVLMQVGKREFKTM